MAEARIRVLVVDDSALLTNLVPEILEGESDINVVGMARDPYEARDLVMELLPDVLVLDLQTPRSEELEKLGHVLEKHPMPVVALKPATRSGTQILAQYLQTAKPGMVDRPRWPFGLKRTSQAMSGRIRQAVTAFAPKGNGRSMSLNGNRRSSQAGLNGQTSNIATPWNPRQIGLIAASTGGTEAIRRVLSQLPVDCPGLCIVLHMPAFITRTFADWLNAASAIEVSEACEGDEVKPGTALVAPGDYHMRLLLEDGKYRVSLSKEEKVWFQRPAADILFKSAAPLVKEWGVGVVLTGMGRDGAEGLLELKKAGAHGIAQDKDSSVVYGMPRQAYKLGAVDNVVPLDEISERLMEAFKNKLVT